MNDDEIIEKAKLLISSQGAAAMNYLLKQETGKEDMNKAFNLAAKMITTGEYKIYESHTTKDVFVIIDPSFKIIKNQERLNKWLVFATIVAALSPIGIEIYHNYKEATVGQYSKIHTTTDSTRSHKKQP